VTRAARPRTEKPGGSGAALRVDSSALREAGEGKKWRGAGALDESGSAIVEFGVSAAVLLLVVFGIVQCAMALYVYNYVGDAARAGTRYAIVRGGSCTGMPDCDAQQSDIQTYLRGIQYPGINSSNLNVTVTWYSASTSEPTTWTACAGQCNAPGNAVQVQVSYAFPLNIPFWKNGAITMQSSSQMVISN